MKRKLILGLLLLFTSNIVIQETKAAGVMIPIFTWTIGEGIKWVAPRVILAALATIGLEMLFRQNGADTSHYRDHKFNDNDNEEWNIDEQNARNPNNNKHNHIFRKLAHGPMNNPDQVLDLAKSTVESAWKNGFRPAANGIWELATDTTMGRLIVRGVAIERTIYYGTIFLEGYCK